MSIVSYVRKKASSSSLFEKMVFVAYVIREKMITIYFYMMKKYPLQNKIVFCSMKGDRYSDNPLYISNYIVNSGYDYEIVWLFNKNVEVELPTKVRRVRNDSLKAYKELATAKVWVDSNMKYTGFLKRQEQLYIQTWHGSYGLKKIGYDLGKIPLVDMRTVPYNMKSIDLMPVNSIRTADIYRRAFGYKGNFMYCGSPKNDIFFKSKKESIQLVKKYFKCEGKKIALYAPTFRRSYSTEFMKLDYKKILWQISNKFGGEWVILNRVHYKNLNDYAFSEEKDVLDASQYNYMQNLLMAAEILITDYSSCMFDFITVPKPCFIYAPDLIEYENSWGNYFRMSELPFPLAQSNDELIDNIKKFELAEYVTKVKQLHEQVGLCETGHASEKVADYIINFIETGKRK
ncbi:CDP-glycerol:poly(glycerophosphate) glycerophosphotransferase [Butyrivibrio proteoclasticus]|uniref:CDP-glycerol:poly(Glycerophosphate) glycerophosphotransferase n=1 Tax=Butyrivibrio proteoclasticus TaxID=43305 RepID=A0A1I5TAZ1_9FIRM|nr:CDP-glycerol glycerophosphotransferase family protein [Butyrivibrio proteoclasticus]SFP80215.1 CDP-glycerol:poly(glycerophosphate) glycerophosphotransferase [Butyrivibrio proteoclasticus]